MSKKDQAPDQDAAAEAAPVKMVRIKVLRDCMASGEIRLPGTIVEVTEKEAQTLCDTKYKGYHPFYGTMPEIGPLMGDIPNPLGRRELVRAVRVA